MQTQRWSRTFRHGSKETITCQVSTVRVKRGRELRTIQSIKSAVSDRIGRLLTSSPMVHDIQEAVNLGRRVSRVYGFRRED